MTTEILGKKKKIFCAFERECYSKQTTTKEKSSQPKTEYAICTWKGRCNQQIDNPKQNARALLRAPLLLCHQSIF
jgi:hypothetical protein